jgi:hypothetical protein
MVIVAKKWYNAYLVGVALSAMFLAIQMLIAAVLGFVLTIFASGFLLLIAHLIIPKGTEGRNKALLWSAGFPFLTSAYLIVACILIFIIADHVGRPVDFGDSWELALGRGYFLVMIDSTESTEITRQNEATDVSDVTQVAQVGAVVLGKRSRDGVTSYFMFDTVTHVNQPHPFCSGHDGIETLCLTL